ncbi:MAG: T9SS type A sorting domain-containing protein [Ignavibacteriaceae bacterium]|nr:T9SS type A sorting domain-containing protein [Ignavibacteriaceae bacterium]
MQKLDAAGNKLYGNDPMYISSGTNEQYTYPIPIPGVNGSYIIGFEGTTGSFPGLTVHLYAQKYSSAGTPQWGSSPVTVCDAGGFPFYELTNIIPDGNFGVVFVWYDDRDFNNNYSTFVQRVDSSGSVLFTANGVEASSLASNQHLNCDVVIDPSTYEIYAFWIEQDNLQSMAGISGQKFSITGTKLWGNNGMTFKAMDSNTDLHMSALFEGGNEYVYYLEYIGATQNNLAKAFSVDGNGNFNWTGNIVTFSSVVSSKSRLVSDVYSNGASVLAWSDGRQDNGGIYAQDIQVDGSFGGIVPVELLSFTAGLNSGIVTLNWVTATETNNKGFEVERLQNYKITGLQYWEIIGFIPGYGTTTETHSYSFEDNNLKQGNYQYRLKQIDFDGSFKYSDIVKVEISAPVEFSLEQNFPNPFNPSTSIQYAISGKQFVSLKIYDLLGSEITTLVNEEKPIGKYEVEFNATGLPSGIYFYKLQAGDFIQTKKMILMK